MTEGRDIVVKVISRPFFRCVPDSVVLNGSSSNKAVTIRLMVIEGKGNLFKKIDLVENPEGTKLEIGELDSREN